MIMLSLIIIVEEFMKISDTDASIVPPPLTTRASIINAHFLFDKLLVCEYRYIPNQVEVYVGTRSLTRFVQSSHSHVTAGALGKIDSSFVRAP